VSVDRDKLIEALPNYEISGELGRGAFGVVLSGRHRQLGREVAIKQLPQAFGADPEVRHRFTTEARTLAALDHPHIVPIFDFVERDGLCVLVMELLPGGSVRKRQEDGFTLGQACAIALATCTALDYAHERGVLHRDIKPDNLLFTAGSMLKVTDFGIAKVVGSTMATRAGETLGTPAYMAPEQCRGEEPGPGTDVYATGVMLYELLSGRLPFPEQGDVLSLLYRHVHEPPPPLTSVAPNVPDGVAYTVMRSLAKDPADRHQSAEGFGVALAEAATSAWGVGWLAAAGMKVMAVGPIHAAAEGSMSRSGPAADPVRRPQGGPLLPSESPRGWRRGRRRWTFGLGGVALAGVSAALLLTGVFGGDHKARLAAGSTPTSVAAPVSGGAGIRAVDVGAERGRRPHLLLPGGVVSDLAGLARRGQLRDHDQCRQPDAQPRRGVERQLRAE
jgi:serine/threonine-protein kinase